VTVDLHCHPNLLDGPHFPDLNPIETLFKEVDYDKKLVGVDHVGIATDLFGLGDTTSNPTHKALVPTGLLSRGHSASDAKKSSEVTS
jgi:microsomal dipeptidase-like Zn-dependent dipeptidase